MIIESSHGFPTVVVAGGTVVVVGGTVVVAGGALVDINDGVKGTCIAGTVVAMVFSGLIV